MKPEIITKMTSPSKIMLIACGSFCPPTPMHLRMFEIARDHFHQLGTQQVIGGIVSPVHDAYGKKGLISGAHRCAMVKIALHTSDWIRLSDWECQQDGWTRTRLTLQYHQNYINSYLKDKNGTISNQILPGWLPDNLKKNTGQVQLQLLCGADLLESFATPGLWQDEDVEAILGSHGIVVISRSGANPEKFIFDSDLLTKHRNNITIVTNWVANEVSSTYARRFLNRGLSVKYLLDDYVIEYIRKNNLFGVNNTKYILTPNNNQKMLVSPITPNMDDGNDNVEDQDADNDDDDDEYEEDDSAQKISLINDNDVYIRHQNNLNEREHYEGMDQTDYYINSLSKKSIITDENTQLIMNGSSDAGDEVRLINNMFCCGGGGGGEDNNTGINGKNENGVRSFLNRPGGAVKITTDISGKHELLNNANDSITDKVGPSINTSAPLNTPAHVKDSDKLTNSDGDGTVAQNIKAKTKSLSFKGRNSSLKNLDLKSLSAPNSNDSATGRISPSKSYNDMIKFVFTEHGIRVISDREYVV